MLPRPVSSIKKQPSREKGLPFRKNRLDNFSGRNYFLGDAAYLDPELYSHGALPPMLNSSARSRDIFGIHPVDSVDMTHPSSLASQYRRQRERDVGKDDPFRTIGNTFTSQSNGLRIDAWDSTSKQKSTGLWRPPGRHLIV